MNSADLTLDITRLKAKPRSPWTMAIQQLRLNRGAVIGLFTFLLVILVALLAAQIAPYDPILTSPIDYLQPPSWTHLFGTDSYGRDIFSRTLFGGRISLMVGLVSVLIAASGGVVLGLLAGYTGGLVDGVIMRFMDVLLSFPGILLALGIVALLGPGISNVVIAVGITGSLPPPLAALAVTLFDSSTAMPPRAMTYPFFRSPPPDRPYGRPPSPQGGGKVPSGTTHNTGARVIWRRRPRWRPADRPIDGSPSRQPTWPAAPPRR